MPNVIAMRIDANGVYLKASNGVQGTLTPQHVRDYYAQTTGTPQERRQQTLALIRQAIVARFGAEMIRNADIDIDVDEIVGTWRRIALSGAD